MKDLITSIFGSYEPVTYQSYIVTDSTTGAYEIANIVPDGVAGLDWNWISGLLIFCIFLFCVLRLLGGIFRR